MDNLEPKKKILTFFLEHKICNFKKREIIFKPGDVVSNIYYIHEGYVRLYCILEDGKELTLNIFKPGSYFPMYLALSSSINLYYYQAITSVKTYSAQKQLVLAFLKEQPDALFEFTNRVVIGLYGLLSNIQYLLFGSVHNRVISAILFLSKRFGEKKGDNEIMISMPVTHQDIANLIGIARETASLEMEKLARQKIISYQHKKITILDLSKLEERSGVDSDTKISDYSL